MRTASLEPRQAEAAGAVLASAFEGDPLTLYLLPDEAERARVTPPTFTGWMRSGSFVVDVCEVDGVVRGVAAWSAPSAQGAATVSSDSHDGLPDEVRSWSLPAQQRFATYFGYVHALHARLMREPHWYLALLGVDPAHQGQGYGSALLRPRLRSADGAGLPCYLETGTARNVALYERHGFRVIEHGTAPGTGVAFWAMRRG